jgi:uncharacterized protein (DUF4213/DUF364 family)
MPLARAKTNGKIATRIAAALGDRDERVLDVRIGLGYTAVQLADGSTGVALTFHRDSGGGCTVFKGLRPLAGNAASELLDLLPSADPIEAAVGLACANALANRPGGEYLDGDVLGHLDLSPRDHVGMVGHFGPLVGPVRKKVRSLTVFEQIEEPVGALRPAKEAAKVLPECQVALITATSIINHSMDDLLQASGNCRVVAVLGASTPLLPGVFAGTPVSLLSGVVVTDPQAVLRIVSEGGGMRFFKPHIRKVNLPLREMETKP